MAHIFNNLQSRFRTGTMPVKLIYVNIGVFIVLRAVALVILLGGGNPDSWLHIVEIPSHPALLLTRPWTVITYMFSQYGILHLLFNMVWLYWFGRIFLFTGTPKQMLALYLYGGIAGALLFMTAYNTLPYFNGNESWLIGSSASVIAIVTATAVRHPDYKVGLLFLGEVALKWIAIVTIGISVLSIPDGNAGGNIAHVGGAIIGAIYGMMLNNGTDITRPLNNMLDSAANAWKRITTPRTSGRNSSNSRQAPENRENDQEILDRILDKIKKSGYTSLTADEKKTLFDVSKRIK
ncbi:MAG: rhomboid family intramembrane serine protease [Muribaculaceae bacterium]|nr:rhomboid family intramembrane serine protease [Muribaculaceae bacterium]